MKNYLIICLLGLLAFGFTSCGETEFQGMEATVGGDSFDATDEFTSIIAEEDNFTITGTTGGLISESITISLFGDFTGEGTYELTDSGDNSALYSPEAFTFDWYDSVSGTVTITTYSDERVEGTFSFEGERTVSGVDETISVTSGQFGVDR